MGNYVSTTKNINEQLDAGVNPNEIFDGAYPVLFNTTDCIQLEQLVENGADLDILHNGKTPLTRAALKNNVEQVRLLLLYGAEPNPVVSEQNVFSDTNPVLADEVKLLLQIYGYPGFDETVKEKMLGEINTVLNQQLVQTDPIYAPTLVKFMRQDDRVVMDRILNEARVYDKINSVLGWNHAALWMMQKGFGLQVVDSDSN